MTLKVPFGVQGIQCTMVLTLLMIFRYYGSDCEFSVLLVSAGTDHIHVLGVQGCSVGLYNATEY